MAGYPPPYPPPGFSPRDQARQARRQAHAVRDQYRAQAHAQKAAAKAQRDLIRYQTQGMRRHSILGPVLILTIGILALLVRVGHMQVGSLSHWYARWWPLLLVGTGLILLAEWGFDQLTAARHPDRPYARRSMGGAVTFAFIAIIATGALANGSQNGIHGFAHGFSINPDNWDQFFGSKHELPPQTLDQPFAPGTSLSVSVPHGDVTINGASSDGQIHITVNKVVWVNSDSQAASKGEQLNPHIFLAGTVLNIVLPGVDGATSDLSISVPAAAPATLNTNHGNISVTGLRGAVNVTTEHGDIALMQIDGPAIAHLNSSSDSISAHGVTGDLTVNGRAGDVTIADIGGRLAFRGDFYGDTHLEHLGALAFDTSRTHFTVARLPGEVDLDSDDISGNQLVGPVQLRVHSRNISFERVAGDIDISNSNGPVELTQALNPDGRLGNINVADSSGDVTLTVPQQAGFYLDADTREGDIEGDLNLSPDKSNNHTTVHQQIGAGQSHVTLNTTHDDITLHHAPVEPPPPPLRKTHHPTSDKPLINWRLLKGTASAVP